MVADRDEGERREIWRRHGARGSEIDELIAYGRNDFDLSAPALGGPFPLADEPCVATWEAYACEAAVDGVAACLRRHLPQCRFAVAAGMSEDPRYRAATRRGIWLDAACGPETREGVAFHDPDGLRLFVHPTAAGRIPVLVARAREDFVTLIRILTARNEPVAVPASMGAMMVAGYNNWERIEALRARHGVATLPSDLLAQKALYQDRFILLSSGPYSAVTAASLGLDGDDWLARSARIRLEHECAHYFTRRVLGSMRNRLYDEILADYAGLVAGAGGWRADWFLRFMGLEAFPAYREGGRLQNYRGDPPLSPRAFAVLQRAVYAAAHYLERLEGDSPAFGAPVGAPTASETLARTATRIAMASLGLERLSVAEAPALVDDARRRWLRAAAASPSGYATVDA